jgi:hypothetical protein
MSDVSTLLSLSQRDARTELVLRVPLRPDYKARNRAFAYAVGAIVTLVITYQILMDWFVFYDAYIRHVEWAGIWLWLLAAACVVSAVLFCRLCTRGIDNWLDWTLSIQPQASRTVD